ncbi:hypothetical protein PanWU01x14_353080, partial [Parasponia andersonii]
GTATRLDKKLRQLDNQINSSLNNTRRSGLSCLTTKSTTRMGRRNTRNMGNFIKA